MCYHTCGAEKPSLMPFDTGKKCRIRKSQLKDKSAKTTIKYIMNICFVIYLLFLLRMTVFRNGFTDSRVFSEGALNLKLLEDLLNIANNDISVFIYLAVGNIVVFIPFGFFVAWYE